MPIIAYNKFYGGISQDNKVYQEGQYAYGENIDGMSDGYGLQLSRKSNKQLLTGSNAIRVIISPYSDPYFRAGGDNGVIYTEYSIDNTPAKTLSNGARIVNMLSANGYLRCVISDSGSATNYDIAKIEDYTFVELSLDIGVGLHSFKIPPMLNLPNNTFAIGSHALVICDNTTYTYNNTVGGEIVGMSLHGTTLITYSSKGKVNYWQKDTTDATHKTYKIISQMQLPTFIDKITSFGGSDYAVSAEGRVFEVAGQGFNEILTPSYSKRLNDSSILSSKLNFKLADTLDNQIINSLGSEIILTGNDTYRTGLYIYGNLFAGLPNGLHKIVGQDYNYNNFNNIYTTAFRGFDNKLLYSYKSNGTNYGIDYIDFNSHNTYKDGFILTPIENCNTNVYKKKLQNIKIITSNTSGNNYIKLYTRYNGGSWNLIRTINNTTDTIERTIINTSGKEFLDIQFKVELHNDTAGINTPILNELAFEYETIQE